jgi:FixJ family two-component response regulator
MPKRLKIAVVDDDLSMLAGIENLLDAHGFATKVFASAEAFLDFFWGTTDIDCLLLDLHLGGMSGIELRRQLKASGSTLPVIFMSALDDDAMRRQALEEGCITYLRKPFLSQLLIDALEKAAR